MPKICNYYVTLRCNDTCEFCQCWQNPGYSDIREPGVQGKEILLNLKREGVRYLNVTGGEPLLREDLPQILKQAKDFGFSIKLTTNGILYAEKAKSLAGLVDSLYFSLDYPIAEEHDRSRGAECFHEVIKAIKLAQGLGESPIINFTMTRDSVRFLPEMIEMAEKLGELVYLNPVYDFRGTQGFDPATYAHIRYYFKRKSVLFNLAALEFVRAGGNRVILPRCRAKETTLTILPDGRRVFPCFFNPGGKQGREDICTSCMRWPYMLPSFSRRLDRYFWLNLYSGLWARRKGVNL
jgi:MoaA/NifB/PqqE/SkfB family radical SAM enzyme